MYLKSIRHFFSYFDFFDVNFSFYSKNKQKYFSTTGGISFILFFIISLIYILNPLKSLINRTSMTMIYYDTPINISFSFKIYSIALSFGITCGSYDEKIFP